MRTEATHRLATGGLIDRGTTSHFVFDDRGYAGHPGDTLASALLANGVKLVGRSFKYHRPRGIATAGAEEPNALVELGIGAACEPNTRATLIELIHGLEARSQNYRGSLKHDVMAANDWLSRFLGAGFYYKTFMWPKAFWEKVYEPIIRSSAGLGRLSGLPDPDSYDKGFLHTDLLIVGAGPAGLSAALAAGRSGARVILADEDFALAGRLKAETYEINDGSAMAWANEAVAELDTLPNVRVLRRTTVYGAYDHGIYGALECAPPSNSSVSNKPRQVLWRIYAKRSLVCAGATERFMAFGNNDRPGIMQAGAVRAYANRWAVAAGKNVVVFTNNDDGWRTATDLQAKGLHINAVVDTRPIAPVVDVPGARLFMGEQVVNTHGRHALHSVTLSDGSVLNTDCLAVAGGWNPTVHLTCHQRGRPVWREDIAAFVPGGELPPGMHVAGAANGDMGLGQVLSSSHLITTDLCKALGHDRLTGIAAQAENELQAITPFWHVTQTPSETQRVTRTPRAWVDMQNDVTTKDITLAQQEGFHAVEHLKRYTTLGMATDQGKLSNVLGLAIMAEMTGRTMAETGTTIFRPPYTPVSIGAFGGRSRGKDFRPVRKTPSHHWAAQHDAVFVEVGPWLRAQWYPQPGETHWRDSVDREVLATRASVGICDVTTLGKIDIQGRDAALFLDRVYANTFGTLKPGKVRYGLMLREDGHAMDDGTTACFSETHFVMTTTTANAVSVFRHMEFCRQCLWPDLDVHLISATDQWAQYAVAGPHARRLLQKVVDSTHDISNDAFEFMACAELTVCNGIPARLFRISFSGELAYEIAVPARYGHALMDVLIQTGKEFGAVPYGTEALGVMRIEKGHAAGNELNGQTTAQHIGLGRMVSKKKDCIGNVLSEREGMNTPDDLRLVGFKPVNATDLLPAGAHFIADGNPVDTQHDEGWMTSVAYSPHLDSSIGLGFIERGDQRVGEIVRAADPLRGREVQVEIVSPHFIDPEGERLRG